MKDKLEERRAYAQVLLRERPEISHLELWYVRTSDGERISILGNVLPFSLVDMWKAWGSTCTLLETIRSPYEVLPKTV